MIAHLVLALLASLALLACGGDARSTEAGSPGVTSGPQPTPAGGVPPPTTADPTGAGQSVGPGAWVLDEPPAGFAPSMVQDLGDQRAVYYRDSSDRNDRFDSPLVITTSLDGPGFEGMPGVTEVALHGRTGYALELWDDGQPYGVMVMWQDERDRWVTVSWSGEASFDDVVAVAASATEIDRADWDHLDRIMGAEAMAGEVRDAVEEIVAEGTSADGTAYRLVALVPPDYPLDENDRRLACYRLDVGDRPGDRRCDSHPWWARVGGTTLVYGPANPDATEVTVAQKPIDETPVADEPIAGTVHHTSSSAPVAFYLAQVPGWCWIQVTVLDDGGGELQSMPGGPLPSNEHHAECMAGRSSPTTAAPRPPSGGT